MSNYFNFRRAFNLIIYCGNFAKEPTIGCSWYNHSQQTYPISHRLGSFIFAIKTSLTIRKARFKIAQICSLGMLMWDKLVSNIFNSIWSRNALNIKMLAIEKIRNLSFIIYNPTVYMYVNLSVINFSNKCNF